MGDTLAAPQPTSRGDATLDPVTITITDTLELGGYQRARCHRLAAEISNLGDDYDLSNQIEHVDSEQLPRLLSKLEAALAALEAIHGV